MGHFYLIGKMTLQGKPVNTVGECRERLYSGQRLSSTRRDAREGGLNRYPPKGGGYRILGGQ